MTVQPAFEYAGSAFLLINTVIFCVFVFAFRPNAPLVFFVKCVAGLATKCPVKEKLWSRKSGFKWTNKRWRRTSLIEAVQMTS